MPVPEVEDWTQLIQLMGQYDTTPTLVAVDASGNIIAVMRGDDAGTLRTLAVDSNGQLYVLVKGSGGEVIAVDANGNLSAAIKGNDVGTLRTVAVDSDGNIISVVKGNDAGTLRTAAVDPDGRFMIVPYDTDDVWGNAIGMGLGELASILSPVKRFDRRGNVVFWDDFEAGYATWEASISGTGAAVDLTCDRSLHGGYAVKLTGGSDALQDAAITRWHPYPRGARIGLSVAVAWESNVDYIRLDLNFRTTTHLWYSAVRYDPGAQDFEYRDSAGAWQDIDASKPLNEDDHSFHIFKHVIDVTAQEYVRAFLDDEEYDLSGVGLQSTAVGTTPAVYITVYCFSDAGHNAVAYVDSVILTENEPS